MKRQHMLSCLTITLVTLYTSVTSQDLNLQCPQGWTEIYSKCYLAVPTAFLPFDMAYSFCQSHGGKLVEPKGFTLTSDIGQLVFDTDSSIKAVWTGYNRGTYPSSFDDTRALWSDGTQTTVDVGVWATQEPNLEAGGCAKIIYDGSKWVWQMDSCLKPLPFVCEATPCPTGSFRCDTGRCISASSECNGENNCGDNSDERNCPQQCSYFITDTRQEIVFPSPSSQPYQNLQTCQWILQGPVGSRLQLEILDLNTESGVDFLEIWGGGMTLTTSSLLHQFSGTRQDAKDETPLIVSSNNMAMLRFISDGSLTSSGFRLSWNSGFTCGLFKSPSLSVEEGSGDPQILSASTENSCLNSCSQDSSCIGFTFNIQTNACTKLRSMPDTKVKDECCHFYVKSCPGYVGNEVLPNLPVLSVDLYSSTSPQYLYSPLYPLYQPGGGAYVWTIHAPGRNLITIKIVDIDLGHMDHVFVFDGPNLGSTRILSLDKTSTSTTSIMSTGNSITIYYSSASFSKTRGFLFSYTTGCDYTIQSDSGVIQSPGFGIQGYPNGALCSWRISATPGRPLRLSFTQFDLESGKDFIQIYKGNSGSQVHSGSGYSGSALPPNVDSSDGNVRVVMRTSATLSRAGFQASYDAGCLPLTDPSLSVTPSSTVFEGDKVTVSCTNQYIFASPYTGQSSVQLTCGSGGQWTTQDIPTCTKVLCGKLPQISNGYLSEVRGVFSGDTATYVCNDGYDLFPTNQPITCTNTGEWNPYPFCISQVQCPPLLAPTNGALDVIIGNGRDTKSIVRFSCSNNYEIVGTSVIICNSGQWSANTPSCELRKCGLPYIDNALLTPSSNANVGDTVSVKCKSGFQLQGTSIFQCGQYSSLPSCENIDECATSTSGCDQLCEDSVGSYVCSCREGFKLSLNGRSCDDVNECATDNGNCDEQCQNTFGSYACSCTSSNSNLFQFDGQYGISIPKDEDGRQPWNIYHLNHSCVTPAPVTCPALTSRVISFGYALTDKQTFSVGDTVRYACQVGYKIEGQASISCLNNGQWNRDPPSCVSATCPFPIVPGVDVTPKSEINYLEEFRSTCDVIGKGTVTMTSVCTYQELDASYQASIMDLLCPVEDVSCGTPTRYAGTESYNYNSVTYGSTFTFNCRRPAFALEGRSFLNENQIVTCMGDGRWDFGDLRCIDPSCDDPGTQPGVIQVATSYEEYSLVSYRCVRSGFEPEDKRPLQCQWNEVKQELQWNGTAPKCVDVEPPTFSNCDLKQLTIRQYTAPSIPDPTATDNVKVASFTITPSQHAMRQILFQDTQVTYTAKDEAGNVQTCDIIILMQDEEPPQISCIKSYEITLQSSNDFQDISMNTLVTSASDNSNAIIVTYFPSELRVDRSSIGEIYTVKATATDSSGNTDMCMVQIKVKAPQCVDWSLYIENGQTSCSPASNGYNCQVTCNQGYAFYEDITLSTIDVSCNNGGDWSRAKPVCVALRQVNYRQTFRLRYLIGTVVDASCENDYLSQLQTKRAQFVADLNSLCSITFPTSTVSMPSESPLLYVQTDTAYATFTMDIDAAARSAVDQCAALIRNAFVGISSSLNSVQRLDTSNICPGSAIASFDRSIQDGFDCSVNEESQILLGVKICVSCPPGFYSVNGQTCSICPSGTYLNGIQGACIACPSDARWVGEGARSEMDCYKTCAEGYTSTTGEALCSICPLNTYSLDRLTCLDCPNNKFTKDDGQWLDSSCTSLCPVGQFSSSGFLPCTPCPRGFYQQTEGATACSRCRKDYTTASAGSTNPGQCIEGASVLCDAFKCLNGGSCIVVGHEYYCNCREGYTGRNCDIFVNPCSSQPCYNNGICIATSSTSYKCDCNNQLLEGDRCENNTNSICDNNPCHNYGGCRAGVSNYFCLCPSYSLYTHGSSGVGSECKQERDPCTAYPCQNGANCEAFGFIRRRCVCKAGYTGDACETSLDGCVSNPCQNSGQCIDGPGATIICDCLDGYGGDFCEQRLDRCKVDTCPSFSTCIDNYQTGQLLCYCQDGFLPDGSGNCVQVITDVCNPNPCLHDGICYSVNDTYGCYCKNGYEGAKCQQNKDDCSPNPCQNGGICTDTNPPPLSGYGFTCQCPSDTYGDTCLDSFDICKFGSNPCNPGYSNCIDRYQGYFCECFTGYYGVNCTERNSLLCDSFPCQHGGICTESGNSYSCQCPSGYEGNQCESLVDYCTNSPCLNQGVCLSHSTGYRCSCPYGFRGDRCEISYDLCTIANPCQAAGSSCQDLRGFVFCTCPAGYSGPYCQTKDVECSSTSCENGATCEETSSGIQCLCAPGYEGSRCESNIDDCITNNCPANSKCVDLLNDYTCVCEDNRIGADCSKEVSSDFDIILSGQTSYQPEDYQTLVQPINQQAFTVSAWMRYTGKSEPGTALSLYGLSSATNVANPSKILSIDKNGLQLEFAGSRNLAFNSPLDDGFWHHVVLAWDSNQGSARLYVDGAQVSSAGSYGVQSSVRPYGWLVLGGEYDGSTDSVNQNGGMIGRLSRVYITSNALSQNEVASLTSDKTAVPAGVVDGYTADIATGKSSAVDYNSELTADKCMSASNCRTLDSISSGPAFTTCPSDQVIVSSRTSQPVWDTPSSSSSSPGSLVKTTKLSGATDMGWETTSVAYAQIDSDGNSDICTFRIYNRRKACERPNDNQGQVQSCTNSNGILRCSVRCSGNQKLSAPAAKYFSCGSNGMFDEAERVLAYEYPSCSACTTPPQDITLSMDYSLSGNPICGSSNQIQAQSTLISNIKSTLSSLATTWSNLCGNVACNNVDVIATCTSQGISVSVRVPGLAKLLEKFDRSETKSFEDIISIAVVDDKMFTYSGTAEPDILSLVLTSVPNCPSGSVLITDCCSECGYGHFFDTASSQCVSCPKGTYLDVLGSSGTVNSSPCKTCPSGTTTDSHGSWSRNDCLASCPSGSFYNTGNGLCEFCPVGFYSEESGRFYCDGCPYEMSTAGSNSSTRTACSVNPSTTTTPAPVTPEPPSVGASTDDEDTSMVTTLLIVLAIILFILVLIIIILFCCFREWMERLCPCLTTKITPEAKSQWHYVDRFGETNLKFVNYKMGEVRRSDKESLVSEDNHSVHTNISLQVPIFEEQLNGSVVKRAVHVAGDMEEPEKETPKEEPRKRHRRKKSKSRRRRQMEQQTLDTEDETKPQTLPPLQKNVKNNAPPISTTSGDVSQPVKRPPSAFNRPKPKLDQVPYHDFVPSPRLTEQTEGPPQSRITLDSDDDLR